MASRNTYYDNDLHSDAEPIEWPKNTPGPWNIDTSENYTIRIIAPWSDKVRTDNLATYGDYRGAHICELKWNTGVPSYGQAIGNARLIAAAPELLKALEDMVVHFAKNNPVPTDYEFYRNAVDQLTRLK